MKDDHCVFENKNNVVTLKINTDAGGQAMVNGKVLSEPAVLVHNDRVRLAENNYFRYIDPEVFNTLSVDVQQEDDTKYDFAFLKEEV